MGYPKQHIYIHLSVQSWNMLRIVVIPFFNRGIHRENVKVSPVCLGHRS